MALEHMDRVVQRLVECVADDDKEVQFGATEALMGLLDHSLEALPSLLPGDEEEHKKRPGVAERCGSAAAEPIAPYDPRPPSRERWHGEDEEIDDAEAHVRFPPARGALPVPKPLIRTAGETLWTKDVCDSPTARSASSRRPSAALLSSLLKAYLLCEETLACLRAQGEPVARAHCERWQWATTESVARAHRKLEEQLREEERRRQRLRQRPKDYVTVALVELFVGCKAILTSSAGNTMVRDKTGRLRLLANHASGGRDVMMHGRTIHGSTDLGQGGLEVAMEAMLMTQDASLRRALLCLLALVTEHDCARRRLSRSEGKAVIFTLTQVSPFALLCCCTRGAGKRREQEGIPPP